MTDSNRGDQTQPTGYQPQGNTYPQPGYQPQATHPAAPPATKSIVGIIVSALVLLGLIGALGWYFLAPKTPSSPAASSMPSASTPATPSAQPSTSSGTMTSLSNLPKTVGEYSLMSEPTAEGAVYISDKKMVSIAVMTQDEINGIEKILTDTERGPGFVCGKLLSSEFAPCYITNESGALQIMPIYKDATLADTKAFTQKLVDAMR